MKRNCTLILCISLVWVSIQAVTINVTKTSGWIETAMLQWQPVENASSYEVHYSGEGIQGICDNQLVRYYADYIRADIPGLKAGTYTLIVKAYDEQDIEIGASTPQSIRVTTLKREGYAFTEGVVPGAYNTDGTPKTGAKVIYVTANNANSVTCDVNTGNSTGTYTGLTNILSAYGKGKDKTPLIIRVIGTVKATDINGLKDGNYLNFEGKNATDGALGSITLEGIGDDATLYGYGICFKRTNGIEVRNLGIMLFGDDAISMDTDNYHNYIHNCDFFYGNPGSDADQAKGDGSIDIKYRSTLATIAYNHFFDSGKVMGCGGATKEETNLLITFHHNWFDHCDSRCPRLNHTTAHIYNNYYDGVSTYGIGCTEVSNAFIESNHFRNVSRPMMIAGQGTDYVYAGDPNKGTFSGQTGGMSKAYNNKVEGTVNIKLSYQTDSPVEYDAWLVQNRNDQVPDTVHAKKGAHVYNNFDTADDMYESIPDDPDAVAGIVTLYAGRMEGGDFKWKFNNNVDDSSHDINEALKSAITTYTTTLVKVQGDTESGNDDEEEKDEENNETPTVGTVTAGGYIVDLINDANSGFATVGQTSNSKGTVTINGVTYDTCLKMGSSSSVTFSIDTPMQLTLYFANSSGKRIQVNGMSELTIPENNIIETTLPEAGKYTIKRTNGESFLFYIALSQTNNTSFLVNNVDNEQIRWFTLEGIEIQTPQKGRIYICMKGQEKRKIIL